MRRGSVLLIVVGMLVVLTILAVAFARLTSLERDAARGVSVHTQARFAAEAGLEIARARLARDYEATLVDSPGAPWAYGDPEDTPIAYAQRPSYGRDAGGSWQTVVVGGSSYGYSGTLRAPPGLPVEPAAGVQYALRIVDLASRFNVNDPNPNLARMLDELGVGIETYTSQVDPVGGRGAQIVAHRDARPGQRYRSLSDLFTLPGFTRAEVDLLARYVTVHGWQDDVLVPRPQASPTNMAYDYETTKRSPVNVNTAPAPVLYALLVGLSARCLLPAPGAAYTLCDSVPIDDAAAIRLVDAILARRSAVPAQPFVSMYDLATFVQANLPDHPGHMPVVMACLNPNAKLVKFNADWTVACHGLLGAGTDPNDELLLADKSDLTYWTTEVCFASTGYFEVTSLGRLIGVGGADVLATYEIQETVRLFEVLRHSTQRDFEVNRVGSTDAATWPENMADQRLATARASALDGQVALDDAGMNVGNATWVTDFSDPTGGLVHRSIQSASTSSFRWTADVRLAGQPPANVDHDALHNEPVYAGSQSPLARSLLNEFHPPALRTDDQASQVHPDGVWYDRHVDRYDSRYGEQVFDAVDGDLPATTGRAIYHPEQGRVEFWVKPDTRFLSPDRATNALWNAKIFDSSFGTASNYMEVIDEQPVWFFYQRQSTLIAGTIHPDCRRPTDWTYPGGEYGYKDYTEYVAIPDLDTKLVPMHWNHVRIQWYYADDPSVVVNGRSVGYFSNYEVWVNGVKEYGPGVGSNDYSWFWMYPPTELALAMPGENQTGYMRFGYLDTDPNAFWGAVSSERSSGTVDQLRVSRQWDATWPVHRYRPTFGTSRWRGRFTLPAGARILSIRYTEYPGRPALGTDVSYTQLEWSTGTASGTTPDAAYADPTRVPAAAVGQTDGSLVYTFLFHDNGQRPFTQSPYVDDVTVHFTTGTVLIDRIEGL